ncbi:toll/interleukin-1 receptor domain-containing protein [Amycolatopsis sp. NPDC026612]|uniref:toll/interleukin-1 receptor domain-containing protein n=1 Tax=Amycolatopsis sp. NPDC026612 TaxID=3155466 RepID=UPI0034000414
MARPGERDRASNGGAGAGPATRIFLSYTGADSDIANRLSEAMRERGAEVYNYGDRSGEEFVRRTQAALENADYFVALISPDAMESAWCDLERQAAYHRQIELKRQFVYVVQVRRTTRTGTGFLRVASWIDLLEPQTPDKIAKTLSALGFDGGAPAPGAGPTPWTVFHNREDELNRLINALTTSGTPDLWLVVSPPKLGKTWFLQEVLRRRAALDPPCQIQLVDLRSLPLEYRHDWVRVLCQLLDIPEPASATFEQGECVTAAAALVKRDRAQLYLLDSADLMNKAAAVRLRWALTTIHRLVKRRSSGKTRVSLIVASRHKDGWEGFGAQGGPRIVKVPLAEFTEDVVRLAVRELADDLSADDLDQWSDGLCRLSEGLPAVLAQSLRWAESTAFLAIDDCQVATQAVFDKVARPYIKDDLLATESLLPFAGDDPKRWAALEAALKFAVRYRLLTQSHLRYHIENNAVFQQQLEAAGWNQVDLWQAMGQTALQNREVQEPWHVLHRPIRRLLYRYYYPDAESRHRSHEQAREFYAKWAAKGAGSELGPILVESLWHETAKLLHTSPATVSEDLPRTAVQLVEEFRRPEILEPSEYCDYVTERLTADREFEMLLRNFDGLFPRVVSAIAETITGGA